MENETGVVVIVGGKRQVTPILLVRLSIVARKSLENKKKKVTPIILPLVELDHNNYSPNSLPAQSRCY